MLNKDLFKIRAGLRLVQDLPGVKFSYACIKNARVIEAACNDLRQSVMWSEQYAAYRNEADRTKEPEALEALRAKYADVIAEYTLKEAEFNALLEEEADPVDLYRIRQEWISEKITPMQMDAISELVMEPTDG